VRYGLSRYVVILCTLVGMLPAVASAQADGPARTFPEFVGTWVLDETASTGRLGITPRIPLRMAIATTPLTITITKQLRLRPGDHAAATPPPESYRIDGSETRLVDERTGASLDVTYRFTLVADMLAFTVREGNGNGSTAVTDAYTVTGDVLTLHRQLTSVTRSGQIRVMQDPLNNSRHTYIYRRERQAAVR
jgi:hypothetical protein